MQPKFLSSDLVLQPIIYVGFLTLTSSARLHNCIFLDGVNCRRYRRHWRSLMSVRGFGISFSMVELGTLRTLSKSSKKRVPLVTSGKGGPGLAPLKPRRNDEQMKRETSKAYWWPHFPLLTRFVLREKTWCTVPSRQPRCQTHRRGTAAGGRLLPRWTDARPETRQVSWL